MHRLTRRERQRARVSSRGQPCDTRVKMEKGDDEKDCGSEKIDGNNTKRSGGECVGVVIVDSVKPE